MPFSRFERVGGARLLVSSQAVRLLEETANVAGRPTTNLYFGPSEVVRVYGSLDEVSAALERSRED